MSISEELKFACVSRQYIGENFREVGILEVKIVATSFSQ